MKGKLAVLVLLVFTFVFAGCGQVMADSTTGGGANSTNSIEKLLGTWVSEADNKEMALNSDGTGTLDGRPFKYGAAGNKLAMVVTSQKEVATMVVDFYISPDGRTLILATGSSAVDNGSLLRKKEAAEN